MATKKTTTATKTATATAGAKPAPKQPPVSSYAGIADRLNALTESYNMNNIMSAFSSVGMAYWNQPQIQNARVKAISTLPCDYTKDELGEFLRNPAESEKQLRQVAEGLKYSSYSVFKLTKSYADMLTYRNYYMPLYVDGEDIKTDAFKRELALVDKITKELHPKEMAHKACMECGPQGKVFKILRYKIDKVHNKVLTIFEQQLPTEWCDIIGFNNISKYTISFNLMYFLQPGTDYRQYGDLFEPYMNNFGGIIGEAGNRSEKPNPKFVYAEKGKKYTVDYTKFNASGEGNPRLFMQNGRWMYYVSLPIDRVWTFEIDDSTPIRVSPFSGLLQTFAQQADYEAAQLSLILQPLLMLITGEIPYYNADHATADDQVKLSPSLRMFFEQEFRNLMRANNTGGVGLYSAPFLNIKSHQFPVYSGANEVSESYLQYGMGKTGLTALIPSTDSPHAGVEKYSAYLESKFAAPIYDTMERMVNNLFESLNLKYTWVFKMTGDIYSEAERRSELQKALDKGDISAYVELAAYDGMSLLDKVTAAQVVKNSGLLELLQVPPTAYTQSASAEKKVDNPQGGAPEKSAVEVEESKIEKQTEGKITVKN